MFDLNTVYGILVAMIVLGVLIFVHELGHFLVAKALNFCVLRFSLGFGPKLFGFVRGETEYCISAIPLGGYVKFYGENAMGEEEDVDTLSEEEKARSSHVGPEREFQRIHPFKRILTVVAGPLFNLVFAWLLIFMVTMSGIDVASSKIVKVSEGGPAAMAGAMADDIIVEIDGHRVDDFMDVETIIPNTTGDSVMMKVKRGTEILELEVFPKIEATTNIFGEEGTRRIFGIIGSQKEGNVVKKRFSVIGALKFAGEKTYNMSYVTLKGIMMLVRRKIPLRENLGGPIMIVQMTGKSVQHGLSSLLYFSAVISISLGILNLLPIPILDGGALVFFFFEMFRGRPIDMKKRLIAQQVGAFMLIALMLFAFYNDIDRLVSSPDEKAAVTSVVEKPAGEPAATETANEGEGTKGD